MTGARLLALLLATVLVGCSSRAPAPIYDRTSNPYKRAAESSTRIERPPRYVVRRGDTLYAIAWRYGLDYRELARWNGIGDPYTIFVGDTLALQQPRTLPPIREQAITTPAPSVTTPAPRPATASTPHAPTTVPGTAPSAASTQRPPATPAPATAAPPPTPAPAERSPAPAVSAATNWQWPAAGPLLSRFAASDAARKGIDIGGKAGDPVRAAAAGEVVYSGSGLVGYGELIIIKHDARFLSAYGHNRRRLVAEGDRVTAGQKIAELGSTGAAQPMLHFEIRDNGQPKDPLSFLPSR